MKQTLFYHKLKLVVLAGIVTLVVIAAMPGFAVTVVLNPYEAVAWDTFDQHRANLHTHTTQSDGELTPSQVVDEYRKRGYTILAITDHNLCTWPWTEFATMERKGKALMGDRAAEREPNVPSAERRAPQVYAYENREPEALGMLAIAGNEPSVHHHCCVFFIEYETRSRELEQTIREAAELNGLVMINHPGRYWSPGEDGSIAGEVVEKYVTVIRDNPNVVGVEVINQGQRYRDDVRLWDRILIEMMPERPVWGFANDDMHALARLGRDWNVFLVTVLDEANVREAMTAGRFYFSTVGTHPQEERSVEKTPVITAIEHDADAGAITVRAKCGAAELTAERFKWFSMGKVVHEGPTLKYRETEGIGSYVRAEIAGDGGTTFTNPIGMSAQ